jgi:hypothetical protein
MSSLYEKTAKFIANSLSKEIPKECLHEIANNLPFRGVKIYVVVTEQYFGIENDETVKSFVNREDAEAYIDQQTDYLQRCIAESIIQ